MSVRVNRILETCLYVDDLPAAESFYRHVLGLEPFTRVAGRHVFYRCGDSVLLLFNPEKTRQPSGEVPTHGAEGPGHVAFAIREAEIPGWREQLAANRIEIEAEIAWPKGGYSLYFRDPSGNSVELATPQTWGLHAEGEPGVMPGPGS
jgi:catechol 2,3-dioxygenase-like lactoylglutathione lyase family enzyme